MAGTYGDMQTRITADLLRDDLSSQIATAILDAIKIWEGQRFGFNEQRYQIKTVVGTEYYSMAGPTLLTSAGGAVGSGERLLEIDSITCTITTGQQPYPLTARTQQWLDRNQAISYRGLPDSYGVYSDTLRIYPIPNAITTLNVSAMARLPTLAVAGDANAWMTEGEGLIREQAKLLLYRDLLRDAEGVSNSTLALYGGMTPNGRFMQGHLQALKRKMSAFGMTGRQPHVSL
jgi:hypothetical protein